jgi:hypothetical protein
MRSAGGRGDNHDQDQRDAPPANRGTRLPEEDAAHDEDHRDHEQQQHGDHLRAGIADPEQRAKRGCRRHLDRVLFPILKRGAGKRVQY